MTRRISDEGLALIKRWEGCQLAVSIAGCATMSGDFCETARAFRPTAHAVAAMSDREKTDILKHNEHSERQWGWKP